ncbi:MAG: DUF6265 family protein [Saprospiraceae bacterium]
MEPKKDISDLIKAGQDRLNETPSRHAWKKLESRLDARKNKHQSTIYRQIAMIAAVVALVAVVALLSIMQQNESNLMATKEYNPSQVFQLENLERFTDVDTRSYQIAELQKNYHGKSTTVINEGPKGKQLLPAPRLVARQNDGYYAANRKNKQPAKNKNEEIEELSTPIVTESTFAMADTKPSSVEKTAEFLAKELPSESDAVTSYNFALEEEEVAETEEEALVLSATDIEPPVASPEFKQDTYDKEIAFGRTESTRTTAKDRRLEEQIEAADLVKTRKKRYESAAKQKTEIAAASTVVVPSKEAFTNINAQSNSIEIDYPAQNNLSLFKWLIGQWHGTTNSGLSIEQWQLKNEFTIEGTGFIIVNGDTTFTEGMRIQKIDQDVYYILTLDQSKKPVRFRLKSYQNQQAVFENAELAFPNQVILQQNNFNNFSTILQNSAPAQIQSDQQLYIQNRNLIQNEQAVRNLSRVKNK